MHVLECLNDEHAISFPHAPAQGVSRPQMPAARYATFHRHAGGANVQAIVQRNPDRRNPRIHALSDLLAEGAGSCSG